MIKNILFLSVVLLVSCSHKEVRIVKMHQMHQKHMLLKHSINHSHRSEANKNRDEYRHPMQTLNFFGIQPHMKVIELQPGSGWYTEILGPYLKNGELTLTLYDKNDQSEKNSWKKKYNKSIEELINNDRMCYGKINYVHFDPSLKLGSLSLGEANSQDMVLTFRSVHGWMKNGKEEEILKEIFKVLKPGGVLGLVQHRADSNKRQDPKASKGYVRADYIINLALKAGFEFVAKSEVNANYLDLKNYPKGVWTLPPKMTLNDKDRAYYLSIGESDRMTLKFKKPL